MTMIKRGSVHIGAEKGKYTGKPRPVIVLQNTNVQLDSVIIIPLTTFNADGFPIRIEITPTPENGLQKRSFAMCDKITVVPRKNLGNQIGAIQADQLSILARILDHLIGEDDELAIQH